MTESPPERSARAISAEMPPNCPDGYICYTEEDHSAIEQGFLHLKKIERWASLAWISCKADEDDRGIQ